MEPILDDPNDDQTDTDQEREQTDTDRTDGEDSVTTPSQSRSPSVVPPVDDNVDVFDGYSFKGRHSILIDSDEDESEEDEVDEDGVSLAESAAAGQAPLVNGSLSTGERTPEPRTPEVQQPSLPEDPADIITTPTEENSAADDIVSVSQEGGEEPTPEAPPAEKTAPISIDTKRPKPKAPKTSALPRLPAKSSRVRREKSGVTALDRDLSDTIDEDGEATEKEDDDDWDFVEAADGEDRNGAQGTSLFARGVVDRYRLAVFRKASTPATPASRSFSGTSKASDLDVSAPTDSPSPSEKQRRGRTPGLTFRKHPRQFLRPKSPHSKKSSASKSLSHSVSATLSVSTNTSSPGMLTPSPSVNNATPITPSLKSKESAVSVGARSGSSGQSRNADASGVEGPGASDTIKAQGPLAVDEPEKQKNKKLKKYKEGAEKVLSLFQSPRPS